MKTLRSQMHWLIALAGGFCMVAAAVTVADRPQIAPPATARDVSELSKVFRSVSKLASPCVVTIETRTKARNVAIPDGDNVPEQLEELFKENPQLKEFFRRAPRKAPPEFHQQQGMGSGFLIDPTGIIVTNNHVVEGADEILVRLQDGREFKGTGVKTDSRTDLAIVKIDVGERLPALKFGDSDATEVGDWVIAIGSPMGQELSVTAGIISAKGRGPSITEREDFLQTDAAINPGNSGGPLLNINGEVVGINTAISSQSGGFDGIGFAVPSKMAYWVVHQLVAKGSVQRAFIGIAMNPIDSKLASKLGLKTGEGAQVMEIRRGSPGEAAKLKVEDVVLTLSGQKVSSPRTLQGIVEQLAVDRPYPVEVLREGKRLTLEITLKPMPEDYSMTRMGRRQQRQRPKLDAPDAVESLDIGVQDVTPEIAAKLAVESASGVAVTHVDPDSPAMGKLLPGDVIEKVNDVRVHNRAEFVKALTESESKATVKFVVRSKDATRVVELERLEQPKK